MIELSVQVNNFSNDSQSLKVFVDLQRSMVSIGMHDVMNVYYLIRKRLNNCCNKEEVTDRPLPSIRIQVIPQHKKMFLFRKKCSLSTGNLNEIKRVFRLQNFTLNSIMAPNHSNFLSKIDITTNTIKRHYLLNFY